MPDFYLDEKKHQYHYDGKIIPSVSEIMQPLTQPEMDKVPPKRLAEARDRGEAVHKAIQQYVLFDYIEPDWKDYVDQFITFLRENDLQVVWCEKALTNGEYAGTIDLLLKTPQNALYLVDTKVTYQIPKHIGFQLGAYHQLLVYNGVSVSRCYCLHLKADRHVFKRIEPKIDEWEALWNEHQNQVHLNS
jgi:hypothetical protein